MADFITTDSYIALIFCLVLLIYVYVKNQARSDASGNVLLKLPLIGDLHSSPIEKPLLNWSAWAKQHGPITVPKLFGIVPIVVLNTSEAVTELFSRRSQWYSNRPSSVSMEMITGAEPGQSRFTLMHDYDEHLKLHHRILAPSLGAPAASKYQPLMELEAKQLLFDLLTSLSQTDDKSTINTSTIYPLLERTQSSLILTLHYSLRIPTSSTPLLHEIIAIQKAVTHLAANPQLPDLIPIFRHLPTFLSPWQQSANKLFASQVDLYTRLLHHGISAPGWNAAKQAKSISGNLGSVVVENLDLAFTLATSIQGGMETSPRQLLWLFVAALSHPGFMERAGAELDVVVGRDRFPCFDDRSKLVYIDAITHELFRWRPISPGSIPRRADRDDEYAGVKIKKGVTVVANAWSISRDPDVFDPELYPVEDFVPERWLQHGKLRTDLPLPVFGQGRRMCLGKKVAVDGMWLNIAHLLWAFDTRAVHGEEVDPWEMRVAGFMTEPKPGRVRLVPRGEWVSEVVRREWEAAKGDVDGR